MEMDMLLTIAQSLRGKTNISEEDIEAWRLQQLDQLGMIDKKNLEIIRKNARMTASELNNLLLNAGLESMEDQEKDMQDLIKEGANLAIPQSVSESPVILNILGAYQSQARSVFNLTNQTMLDSSKRAYIDIINYTVMEVSSGYKTSEQAIRSTIKQWADKGVPALIDRSGREWSPESYVRTVIRSTNNNMINEMQDARFIEYGVELVEVSSHSGARPLCAPYQGRIYSIRGDHPRYSPLSSTSIGQAAGLFGVNCRHRKYPYVEGVSVKRYEPYKRSENDKVYQESQRQRVLENAIRKAKRREEMLKAIDDAGGVKQVRELIRKRQAALREFLEQTGRTRRRYREQIYN